MGRPTTGWVIAVLFVSGIATAHATPGGSESSSTFSTSVDSACSGLDDEARSTRVFSPERVIGAQKLTRHEPKNRLARSYGARVIVRAEPGLTAPYLERVAACQVAQYMAGSAEDRMGDPLAAGAVDVRVVPVQGAFAVHITTHEPSVARAVFDRAERLRTGR